MDFKALKLSLSIVTTLSLLGQVSASAAPTNTDGKVTFEFDTEDLGIVQPGTNVLLNTGGDHPILSAGAGGAKSATEENGFVQLLFAPHLDFGTVKADYKQEKSYPVLQMPVQATDKTKGFIDQFAQVVDYTDGTVKWDLNVQLASKFYSEEANHTLNATTINFATGGILSDVADYAWSGTSLTAGSISYGGGSKQVLAHDSTDNMVNGAKWSYVFGLPEVVTDAYNAVSVKAGGTVDRIHQNRGTNSAINLVVPASDKPKVGKLYEADLLWTLSSTPSPIIYDAIYSEGNSWIFAFSPQQLAEMDEFSIFNSYGDGSNSEPYQFSPHSQDHTGEERFEIYIDSVLVTEEFLSEMICWVGWNAYGLQLPFENDPAPEEALSSLLDGQEHDITVKIRRISPDTESETWTKHIKNISIN
jgi:hypothetical protein